MIYIASQVHGTVTVCETLPLGYEGRLEELVDEGPARIEPKRFCAPPRRMATTAPERLRETHGYPWPALVALPMLPPGCYYWTGQDWAV